MKRLKIISTIIIVLLAKNIYSTVKSTATAAGLYLMNPSILVVDDFDDGVPPNNLGAPYGTFASVNPDGQASIVHVSTMAVGGSGCSLEISYDVSTTNSYSGYWTRFHYTNKRDLSDYKYLSFYIRGEKGGELFKVQLTTGPGGWPASVYINDYLDGGVSSTTWQKVVIPFENFVNINALNGWSNIYELCFVFESTASNNSAAPTQSKIYVDNIVLGQQQQPIVRIDHFGDNWGPNALGGAIGDMWGDNYDGAASHEFVVDTSSPYPRGFKSLYNNTAQESWCGHFFIFGGTATTWGAQPGNFSNYNYLTFLAKADTNVSNIKLELKYLDNNNSEQTSAYWLSSIGTTWSKKVIPLSEFPGLDKSKIIQFNIIYDRYNGTSPNSATVYYDAIQFENSNYTPDTTPPAAPTQLKIMDSAEGRYVNNNSSFTWINYLIVKASSSLEDPTIECVRFEYRPNGGNWVTIGTDYDTSDNIYWAYWDTSNLSESDTYEIRCVARDTSGNESATSFTDLTVKHYPSISSMSDEQLLDILEKQIFWYFWVETNPEKGIVQDRARNFIQDTYGYTSVAATGLGLCAICIAHSRGWISFTDAYNRVYKILKTYYDAPDSTDTASPMLVHHNGFYYHYTDFGGARAGNCELSTIDTTLFLCGALFAGKYFQQLGYQPIWDFADQLYKRVNWQWMLNNNDYLDWGWTPEGGFNQGEISSYSEGILAYILGAGSPDNNKKIANASGWNNITRKTTSYAEIQYVLETSKNPLFVHQFPLLFLDLSGKKDNSMCYAQNSFLATIVNRKYCYDNKTNHPTYGENSWGLSATELPNSQYTVQGPYNDEGVVTLSSLFTSAMFSTKTVVEAFRYLYDTYTDGNRRKLWGKYGFSDGYTIDFSWNDDFNDGSLWKNPDVVGVQQGAVLIAIENARTGLVKNTLTSLSYIQNGLSTLGFTPDTTPPAQITTLVATNVSGGGVKLSWTSTGDDGYTGNISSGIYEVRFSTNPSDTFDTAPDNYLKYNIIWSTNVVPNRNEERTIYGLPSNTTYYFWIALYDDSFNRSISNKTTIYAQDTIPPAKINNLSALKGTSGGEIKLSWSTPGDDGNIGTLLPGSMYKIQYSSSLPVTWSYTNAQITISTNGVPVGTTVSYVVDSLEENVTYYFRIWTCDEVSNWSELSNGATSQAQKYDQSPPAAITTLVATTSLSSGCVDLSWLSPGDDGDLGVLQVGSMYKIQYATWTGVSWSYNNAQVTISTSGTNPGTNVGVTITGLVANITYYFRIWTRDEADNCSGLSNGATAQARLWVLWNNCDSRRYFYNWGPRIPTISRVMYDGCSCLGVSFPSGNNGDYAGIRTDFRSEENWNSPVTGFKVRIYASNNANLKLSVYNSSWQEVCYQSLTMTGGQWNTLNYTFSGDRSSIARIFLIFENLPSSNCNFYIDQLELVGSPMPVWDTLDVPPENNNNPNWYWELENTQRIDNEGEAISHNYACSLSSAAALHMRYNGSANPKVYSSGDFNVNWSNYKSIRVRVYCDNVSDRHLKVGFYDGTNTATTNYKEVPGNNQWYDMMWNLPTGIDWSSVNSIQFIGPDSGSPSGNIYIDHIEFSPQAVPE